VNKSGSPEIQFYVFLFSVTGLIHAPVALLPKKDYVVSSA